MRRFHHRGDDVFQLALAAYQNGDFRAAIYH